MKKLLTHGIVVVVSLGIGLIIAECSLWLLKYPKLYHKISIAIADIKRGAIAKWWIYDPETGTKFNKHFISEETLKKPLVISPNWKRLEIVNEDGYHDTDEFTREKAEQADLRALVLGDSFAWGASADLGSSFVEVFEERIHRDIGNALIWNTSIPASGTTQQLLVLQKYAPIMNPQYVILCFFENDFADNILPVDRYLRTASGLAVDQYKYDATQDQYVKLTQAEMVSRLRYSGKYPLKGLLLRTRIGNIAYHQLTRLIAKSTDRPPGKHELKITKEVLEEVWDLSQKQGGQLLVLLIPSRKTVQLNGKSARYKAIITILEELGVSFVNPLALLDREDYQPPPDNHWNSSGHKKVGAMLYDEFRRQLSNL